MRFVCVHNATDLSKSNQINVHTVFRLANKFACDRHDFFRPSGDGFFRILPEVIDPRRCTKGSRPLGTRL